MSVENLFMNFMVNVLFQNLKFITLFSTKIYGEQASSFKVKEKQKMRLIEFSGRK